MGRQSLASLPADPARGRVRAASIWYKLERSFYARGQETHARPGPCDPRARRGTRRVPRDLRRRSRAAGGGSLRAAPTAARRLRQDRQSDRGRAPADAARAAPQGPARAAAERPAGALERVPAPRAEREQGG